MGFSQSSILKVNPPITTRGETHYSWTSSSPPGQWYQLYRNRVLSWYGQATYADLPAGRDDARIDIGTVAANERATDFSADLAEAPKNRALLTWVGGSFLDPLGQGDVAGFKVFGSSAPAGYGTGGYGTGGYGTGSATISYASPLATIPAYTGPASTDGYGMGGYGAGGYGASGGSYSWESDALWSGLWSFAVAAFDHEGDLGTITTADITIAVPPRPPGWRQAPPRLTYQIQGYGGGGYGSGGYGMPVVDLTWLASPG